MHKARLHFSLLIFVVFLLSACAPAIKKEPKPVIKEINEILKRAVSSIQRDPAARWSNSIRMRHATAPGNNIFSPG